MALLRYYDTGGTEQEVLLTEAEIDQEFNRVWSARAFIRRDTISETNVEKAETEMYIVDDSSQTDANARFGGILRDINRKGGVTEVLIDSFETLALDAQPTGGGERWENASDDTVVQDAISDVPQISAGTIDNLSPAISLLFTHASPAKKIRSVADVSGAEVAYRSNKTVDYVDRLGSDRTSITLSPSNQNISDDFQAEKKGGEERVTHLRVLGAGEGRHQRVMNFVPGDDSASYENKQTYTNPDWSSGDRKLWEVISNKELTDDNALQEWGHSKITDMTSDVYIDAETTVSGLEVNLGDSFHVEHPDEDVDADMRVVRNQVRLLPDGIDYEVKLSTRVQSRIERGAKDRQDIQRFNKALQGTAVPINASGGRQPVNGGNNYQFKLYYPGEVKYEHRLNVRVMGLPYRAYSSGTAAGGSTTETTTSGGSSTATTESGGFTSDTTAGGGGFSEGVTSTSNSPHGVTLLSSTQLDVLENTDGNWNVLRNLFEPTDGYELAFIGFQTSESSSTVELRIKEANSNTYYPVQDGVFAVPNGHGGGTVLTVPGEAGDIEVQYRTNLDPQCNYQLWWYFMGEHTHDVTVSRPDHTHTFEVGDHQHQFDWLHEHTVTVPDHTHDIDPGIIESFDTGTHYPENCDVIINGSSVGTSFGDGTGPFQESVDVTGMLMEGQVNTIEVTSDSLGHLQTFVEGDVYRQILGTG